MQQRDSIESLGLEKSVEVVVVGSGVVWCGVVEGCRAFRTWS